MNGENSVLESILPLVKKYGAAVVGLTLDEKGIPETAEGRFAVAQKICLLYTSSFSRNKTSRTKIFLRHRDVLKFRDKTAYRIFQPEEAFFIKGHQSHNRKRLAQRTS